MFISKLTHYYSKIMVLPLRIERSPHALQARAPTRYAREGNESSVITRWALNSVLVNRNCYRRSGYSHLGYRKHRLFRCAFLIFYTLRMHESVLGILQNPWPTGPYIPI